MPAVDGSAETSVRSVIAFLQIPSNAGYAGVALLVGGESAGLPVPGETSLIAASVIASQGHLSLPLVIAAAAAAAIVGDNIGYLIGRSGGRLLIRRPGRSRRLLARAEIFFDRHGAKAVFLGRWVPWLRITAAWLAGASRMRWWRFLLWNALGGAAWATSVGLAAFFLGQAASTALGGGALALLALLALAGFVTVLVRRRRRAPGSRQGPRPASTAGRSRA